ncbi:MAG TPA: GMC family oxidoreductase [Thermodesulfobacteriota bacterium]|nr:GMC family oxidoreductase [Thermodesulfobacteriota bacterium]
MSILTGRDVQRDLAVECDVCVVGSGAGGACVAERLAAAGKRVVVLEEGGYHTSDTFTLDEADTYPRLYQERGTRATADLSIIVLQGRAVGGTTVVNWTTCLRTPPHVFEHWAEHHGVEGLTYETLVPHWERLEARLNVKEAPLAGVNRNNRVLWEGAGRLGWQPELLKRNVKDCAWLGYCGLGCPTDAKQSMLVTLVPDAVRHGADVYANVRVETIEADGRRIVRVNGRVLDPDSDRPTGRTVTVRPKVAVLACGGLNTPALLLRSRLGTGRGRVGRRTFLHPVVASLAVFDEPIEAFYGIPQTVACRAFARRAPGRAGFFIEAAPLHPMFAGLAMPGLGDALREQMDALARTNVLIALVIDGFDPSEEGGTVTLKANGEPRLDYRWTPRLVEAFREASKRMAEIQFAAGAPLVRSLHTRPVVMTRRDDIARLDRADFGPNRVKVFSAHVMGGCAMGRDPARSVVDSRLRHHEFDNLFVVDGSVFPTSLGVNPQLTIYGLASWAAETIRQAAG